MQKIPEHIKQFLDEQKLGYVATISENNTPNLSPKGTIIAWDDKTLVFADIHSPNTIKNLERNPHLEINVVDPLLRRGYRFAGKGYVVKTGEKFEAVLAHYRKNGIRSPINSVVMVDVDRVSQVISPLYDLGLSESEIKEKWKKYFASL